MSANKWRQQCSSLVGQRITVRDRNGQTHHGVLHGIRNEGIILSPIRGVGTVAASASDDPSREEHHAIGSSVDTSDVEAAFWPAWFLIAWALIAALWAWGWAGFHGRRPYYGYGPGYNVYGPFRRGYG